METGEVLEIGRQAIYVVLKMGAPTMLIALLVGLTISLFQALTQIQEMTLAFVPKILVIFVTVILMMPFMLSTLKTFTEQLAQRMIGLS